MHSRIAARSARIELRLPGERMRRLITAGKTLEFTDEQLPAGDTTYSIRVLRGDQPGPWHVQLTVTVGMGAGAVGNLREVRLAA